ncbi:hypothetical protein ACIPEN_14060 [Herbaspirillum chlorophenolicum]|uniref:Secreted protein n=1 Tax=Herbaspirillum chlorophenolicum TaxID=211589 RepID=A0ABW8F0Y1_9BURK
MKTITGLIVLITGFSVCGSAVAQLNQRKPSQAQEECEKTAREAPACGPNNTCAERKLKEAERWCIQWIRENTPSRPTDLSSAAMGTNTK